MPNPKRKADYAIRLVTPPAAEPVTLAECKAQLLIATSVTAHDTRITSLLTEARELIERETRRQLITATWRLTLDRFPPIIHIPRAPLLAISSLTYTAQDGTTATIGSGSYLLNADKEPATIQPLRNQVWPTPATPPANIVCTFTAGYGASAASVPEQLRQAILHLVAHRFENRTGEAALPQSVRDTITRYELADDFLPYAT